MRKPPIDPTYPKILAIFGYKIVIKNGMKTVITVRTFKFGTLGNNAFKTPVLKKWFSIGKVLNTIINITILMKNAIGSVYAN